MNELALFAGAGGGILGGKLLGWRTLCAVERDAYAAQVLAQRQNDGILRPFPIWSDITTFDGKPWRGRIDVISGGFPCQDISIAGHGTGIAGGGRSGLWSEFKRIICEVKPKFAFVENSPMLTSRGLGIVLRDLAELGFDAEWGVLGANATGLDHLRQRIWVVAHANGYRWERKSVACDGYEESFRILKGSSTARGDDEEGVASWRRSQPRIQRMVDGLAFAVERHKVIGNGQVPIVAATAWKILN